ITFGLKSRDPAAHRSPGTKEQWTGGEPLSGFTVSLFARASCPLGAPGFDGDLERRRPSPLDGPSRDVVGRRGAVRGLCFEAGAAVVFRGAPAGCSPWRMVDRRRSADGARSSLQRGLSSRHPLLGVCAVLGHGGARGGGTPGVGGPGRGAAGGSGGLRAVCATAGGPGGIPWSSSRGEGCRSAPSGGVFPSLP